MAHFATTLKETPDMLPYAQLSDKERDYDRNMSTHTLKLILAQGYQLIPLDPPVPALIRDGPAIPDKGDMVDEQDLQWLKSRIERGETFLQPLEEGLQWLDDELGPSYREADESATRQQQAYLRTSFWCLVCAALAVLLAIYQLAGFPTFGAHHLTLPILELVLVILAVGLVLWDIQNNWKDSWLANRSRAERLRSLKFRALLDPKMWSSVTRDEAKANTRGAVRQINSISPDHLIAHLADAELDTAVPDLLTGSADIDRAIGNYYIRRRLVTQAEYAAKKEHEYHKADLRTKLFGTVFFFGVVSFVFAHAVLEVVQELSRHETPVDDWAQKVLIAFAAILPAAGAALHVYRDGREAGRNHLRTMATRKRLSQLHQYLEGCRNRKDQIRLIVQSEIVLASEHEQWLNLMKACDWYG
jgi:hypothetical protein